MAKSKINPDAPALIDEYILSCEPFAQEILHLLRELIHKAVPDVVEDWKWGPNFNYSGMICGFAGFKKHAHLAFFNGAFMKDPYNLFAHGEGNAHNRGIKFKHISEIKPDLLMEYFIESAEVNKSGINIHALKSKEKKELEVPEDYHQALEAAEITDKFYKMSFTHRKEHILYITEAKKQETRERRILKSIEMILKHPQKK